MDRLKKKAVKHFSLMVVLMLVAMTYGTLGFYLIEERSLFDSFYMAVITMTTVGFREVIPLSQDGRLFAVTVIFTGLTFSGVSIGLLSNLLFEDTLLQLFKGGKMEKQLKKVSGHFIVCGHGITGKGIVTELLGRGETVVVIDRQSSESVGDPNCMFLQGDARKDEVLIKAGIARAGGLATSLTEDADNVFVTLTARALNPDLRIVSRFKDDDTEKKLLTAGADLVISPYRLGGQRLADALTAPQKVAVDVGSE